MGFRQAVVLASVCFAFGILFVCFTVDHKLLFGELTEQTVDDGFFFYTTFYNAPPVIRALLHSVVGIGVLGLIAKLHKWDDTAMFFDGSSLAAYVFAIGVYISVSIPSLRTIVDPVVDVDTREDRIEAMRVLAAGNTIIMVLLGAVLCLQGGEEYSRRFEAKEIAKWTEKEKAKTVETAAEKKEQ
ncbi:uncharacterized protein FOMMEDRAFT_137824 [Fomitiporia mediterranea MF3/22]|uniref:uncharacterized protein n=1 Tax=Fomitiporia mediterranea (strain MF3/22) TaxID=694068 RepID=UPI00044087E1|nr:uncharacterized protein FOMMEDRAFT_137824 [Fomitiporia mediterranea MF3/22]EJD07547.1 hypothetical protein FOMMEDRAFT_137824 [Fomitiporia mediterranea MF3/22]